MPPRREPETPVQRRARIADTHDGGSVLARSILFKSPLFPRYRGSLVRGRGPACVALLSLSCLRADPNHCANQDGDATCRELGAGEFCSACAGSNFGCLDEPPEDACAFEGSAVESSSTTDLTTTDASGSEDDPSSTGPPPACALEGEEDPSCPDAVPYCVEGECRTCADAAPDFCAQLAPARPACHPQWGRCVECNDDNACEGEWCGNDFTCGGCTEHWQCPNSACDLERGECMDDDLVMHVDNSVCPDAGSGTEDMPYCSLSTAVQQITMGERGTILLHRTTNAYDEAVNLTANAPRTVAVVGIGEPTIVVPGTAWAVVAGVQMRVYVSGTRLSSGSGSGAQCMGSGARLWLDDAVVYDNDDGLVVDRCVARVRRTQIIANEGYGIAVLGKEANLLLESSVVANNGSMAADAGGVYIDAGAIDIRYSTIARNTSMQVGRSIRCVAGGGGPIRSSILLAAELDSLDCPWADTRYSVHDNVEIIGSDNYDVEIFDETWFQNVDAADFHVRGPAMSLFRDRAQWELGHPRLDLDREPRLAYPGAPGFAGADEP